MESIITKGKSALALGLWAWAILALGAGAAWAQTAIQTKISNPQSGYATGGMGNAVAIDGSTMVVGASDSLTSVGVSSGLARVYAYDDALSTWTFQAALSPADPAKEKYFAKSVAVSGDTAVIGATGDAAGGNQAGAAYVFTRSGGAWSQQAKLTAPDAAAGDLFGGAVAISSDTLIVGANAKNSLAGAAYVFTRSGGAWSQQQKLTPSDTAISQSFAGGLALAGDVAMIGASGDSVSAGAVYVFTRGGGVWSQQQKLTASDAGSGALFGASVAFSGKLAVVGASGINLFRGAAYIFKNADGTGTNWTQQAKLTAPGGGSDDYFGSSVSIAGQTALIGAYGAQPVSARTGAAFVFVSDEEGTTWTEQTVLCGTDSAGKDNFGAAVALAGNTAVIGAPWACNGEQDSGAAYCFMRNGADWSQAKKLTGPVDTASNDHFGATVACDGDTVLVGVPADDNGLQTNSGAAYVWTRGGNGWNQQARLTAAPPAMDGAFGSSVAIAGDTALVGEPQAGNAGRVSVFTRDAGGTWSLRQTLEASDTSGIKAFGSALAIDGDTALIAASGGDSNLYAGAAFVFKCSGGVWSQDAKFVSPDSQTSDLFGAGLALSGDTALVSSVPEDGTSQVYVFMRTGPQENRWEPHGKLSVASHTENDFYGLSLALSGNTALVSAMRDDGATTQSGAAYVFTRSDSAATSWTEQAKLFDSAGALDDLFGYTVALSGDIALISAPGDSSNLFMAGSACVFARTGTDWAQKEKLTASDAAAQNTLGFSAALSGTTAVLGTPRKWDPEVESGAVYIFEGLTPVELSGFNVE